MDLPAARHAGNRSYADLFGAARGQPLAAADAAAWSAQAAFIPRTAIADKRTLLRSGLAEEKRIRICDYRMEVADDTLRLPARPRRSSSATAEGNRAAAASAAKLNVTDRKRAEAALQTTLQRFYSTLSSMYGSILLVSNEGRVEFANQSFCDLFEFGDPADWT